jgi:tripartite-type tricarboxylate transporter receptor subunit TctC
MQRSCVGLGTPIAGSLIVLFGCCVAIGCADAESVSEFYRGKQVRLIIGNAPGADYDLGGRLLARHMSRYIPGEPVLVVQNMQGAAGVVAANHVYSIAPKDGTVFATLSRNIPGQGAIGREELRADPRRFSWIGSSGSNTNVCYVAPNSPVQSADDLFTRELIVGGVGPGSAQTFVPTVLNRIVQTKFRIVEGYKGVADALLAMQRHEIDGLCSGYGTIRVTQADALRDGRIRILLNSSETALADHPDVPSVYRYAKSEREKRLLGFVFSADAFGRPYFGPPGIPRERLAALRTAFRDALQDPDLKREAEKAQMDVSYRSAEDLEAFVARLYATPRELIAEIKEIMPAP